MGLCVMSAKKRLRKVKALWLKVLGALGVVTLILWLGFPGIFPVLVSEGIPLSNIQTGTFTVYNLDTKAPIFSEVFTNGVTKNQGVHVTDPWNNTTLLLSDPYFGTAVLALKVFIPFHRQEILPA